MTSMFNDPNLQVVPITDFSPGIFNYGNQAYPSTYTARAPIGSASRAFRCINRPGIGLIPFYNYTNMATWGTFVGNSPLPSPWANFLNTGLGCMSGVVPNALSSALSEANIPATQLYPFTDYLITTWVGVDNAGKFWSSAARWMSTNGFIQFNSTANPWLNISQPICTTTSIDLAAQPFGAVDSWNFLVMTNGAYILAPGYSAYFAPGQFTGQSEFFGITTSGFQNWGVLSHGNRVLTLREVTQPQGGPLTNNLVSTDTLFQYSDPPAGSGATSFSFAAGILTYSLDNATGYGAWGSVSTGELILIRRGGGGVVVSGDPAFPNFVTKLPALQGTGLECQRMAVCNAGAVYVTEQNGVWAWNGGNTSVKVSQQIPDNACIRTSLLPGNFAGNFGVAGVRQHSDVINNMVFFANNWVFDSINNSWWQCEDPSVVQFATFFKSQTNIIYTMEDTAPPGGAFHIYGFDIRTLALTWQWTSNPIPSIQPGVQNTLSEVEICVSNPFNAAATIIVTPQTPPTAAPDQFNTSQPLTFIIPAMAQQYRASQRCGFTDNNVCVDIKAAGGASNPAPALHELNLGFSAISTTGR